MRVSWLLDVPSQGWIKCWLDEALEKFSLLIVWILTDFCLFVCFFLFFFLRSPAISLGFTTLGEIFAYVTVF